MCRKGSTDHSHTAVPVTDSGGGTTDAATNGHSGVEAAKTGESDAQERRRECSARDGTVGVAQYVAPHLTGLKGGESMHWR